MNNDFLTVAIVGSGPAGCYTAQFLRKEFPNAEITIFEKLPVPYGLIRYGIAPDHQGTKNITSQFDRMFTRDGVRFVGNVNIGTTISEQELLDAFDIVVAATGLYKDRLLNIPGGNQKQIFGAGRFLRTLNSYPESDVDQNLSSSIENTRPLGKHVTIIGNGNVAMDVIRLIAKDESELLNSDINDNARKIYKTHQVKQIDVIGRSSITSAKFDMSMLKEISKLSNVQFLVQGVEPNERCAAYELFEEITQDRVHSSLAPILINFIFNASPLSISRVNEKLTLSIQHNLTKNIKDIQADSIITAIGFERENPVEIATYAQVYPVGWANRGPIGTVAENRRDAKSVVKNILSDLSTGKLSARKPGFYKIKHKLHDDVVDFEQWKKIDSYELSAATTERCRQKIISVKKMLDVAKNQVNLNLFKHSA
ncbi:NADPH-ferredoxin reductase FprA [Acinetobacter schindleri]|uniref:FAD-dependent oxidoreductase n=1 Tax=Acinetobacter schindleri TaxID=108981 RepID=UPI003095A37E